ncbi:MAG: UDP-N-acetylmuramoylalanine--D-glutamate ligase [Candidatus Aminicenantes bacterium RBG_16_63_16]|nr:MAG: UDP-N-acetylmuramoylalanine--D-glutamate ligase [Candidatus Aminicenantes bacterium RBG_16_63_16]
MEIAGKKALVVGLGKTGEALAGFLLARGARVTVTESRPEESLGRKAALWKEKGVCLEAGGHKLETFLAAEFIVPSPGAAALPQLAAAKQAGVQVIAEIDLARRFLKGKVVGITGTNGKSTTATLAHKILKEAGLKSRLAGNIGTPLIAFAAASRDDHIHVTEISSFQLEHVESFHAEVAAFLNISINHLDWHGSFESYFSAKKKLLQGQRAGDTLILNRDDRLLRPLAPESEAQAVFFSRRAAVRRGCYLRDGWLTLRDGENVRLMKAAEVPLPGLHNLENVMAAALVGRFFGVSPGRIRASIRKFHGLEHRLEKVLTLNGVTFVNDSKATTVDATIKALESFDRKIVLILGGRDKGADFSLLRRPVRKQVKAVIIIGEAGPKIARALLGAAPIEETSTLRGAVTLAFSAAGPGDIVLLAPACTSFDMFRDFENRGRAFKREVRRLKDVVEGGSSRR